MLATPRLASLLALLSLASGASACSGVATGTSGGTSGTSGGRSGFDAPTEGSGGTETGGSPSDKPAIGTPTSGKKMFVTSQTFDGDLRSKGGGSDGRAAADALCQIAADGAVLGGKYKAYLGNASTPPTYGLADSGPWYLPGGQGKLGFKVFNNKANLSTTPLVPLNTDERAFELADEHPKVWTGVSGDDCNGWSSNSASLMGGYGSALTSGAEWRAAGNGSCSIKFHLYCVEQ